MIVYGVLLILLLVHAMPWAIFRRRPLFQSPEKLGALLSFVTIVPYFSAIAVGAIQPSLQIVAEGDLRWLLAEFGLLYSVGLAMYFLGAVCASSAIPSRSASSTIESSPKVLLVGAIVFAVICVSFIFLKLQAIGGLVFLVDNLGERAMLAGGTGVYDVVIQPAAYLSVFLLIYLRGSFGFPPRAVVVSLVVVLFVLLSVFGGRKVPLYLAIFSMLAYSLYVKRVRFFAPSTLLAFALLIVFFVGMLQVRGSYDYSGLEPELAVLSAVQNASYIDTYLFVMTYFSENGLWYGRPFGDLVLRALPGLLAMAPPPIDDGVYIRTLYEGWIVSPPTSFEDLFPSSWPPETFGNGYLNFGAFGVLFFFFVRGLVVGGIYGLARRRGHPPQLYFLFLFSVFNFHLTNLRIVQFFAMLVGVGLLSILLVWIRRIQFA